MASTTVKPPPAPPGDGLPPPGGSKPIGVARAAGIMMAATLLSRLLGLIRDQVIAAQMGVSANADVYTGVFRVCDLLMYLVAGGALASTLIPVFKEYLYQNKVRAAWRTFSIVATVTAVIGLIFIAAVEIFPATFVHLTNSGYSPAKVQLGASLVRIIVPAQLFFLLGGLMMGTLNARGQFLIPSLSPSVYNLGIIFGALFLYPHMGLAGLMWGALIGAFVGNIVLQVGPALRTGMQFRPSLAVTYPGAVRVWKMMLPILLGVSLPNVDQIVNGYFASQLPTGSQAALNYAVRLMLIPIGVFGQAMGVAILPTMSEQAAGKMRKEFRETTSRALRTILFLTIPASALLFLLAVPTISLLFQHKHFTAAATLMTALPLRFYAIGIFAWSAQAILTRGFYALQDTRTPVLSGTAMTVVFVCMNWLVVHVLHWGVAGLALATSIAATLHMLVMYVLLRRRTRGLQDGRLMISVLKTLLATAALCFTVWIIRAATLTFIPLSTPFKLTSAAVLLFGGGSGIAAFLVTARLLRMDELQSAISMVRRRGRKSEASA
jgi:putative peptidoglycan lipid II flippase